MGGLCLRVKYAPGAQARHTAAICWAVAIAVCLGNTLYECNNWAGGIDAIFAIPGVESLTVKYGQVLFQIVCCLIYAGVVLLVLYWDKVEILGQFLGVVM